MTPRLLIINCPSAYFVHIPMGAFGLCDYLSQKNIEVRLLNLALYGKADAAQTLNHYLNLFRPTHVGLILHWQETVEGALWVGEQIESRDDGIKIICGGFTAGYFGEDLLKNCRFVDYVIKGDPELPLERLVLGAESEEVPNLMYRSAGKVQSNEVSYFIDQEAISGISFCSLACLYDYELYVSALEEKLGFPVCIGRGCVFGCRYCGGSAESFRLHSGRAKPVVRRPDAVIADLKQLKDFTTKIYVCYEVDRAYMKALFRAMKREKSLVKVFHLNYGAWQLFDSEFLELYKNLFVLGDGKKPILEISPEVFDDCARQELKYYTKAYSMQQLGENLGLVQKHLGDKVKVHVFFSRYHDTARTYAAARKEIGSIFRFEHELLSNQVTNVKIHYDHLSTDVGSHYWQTYVQDPGHLDTLIAHTRILNSRAQHSFPVDNLCIYVPETLSEEEIFRCELLIFILKTLREHFHELFHILFRCLGDAVIELIETGIMEAWAERPESVFMELDRADLLHRLKGRIIDEKSLFLRVPFIEDLISLQIKKVVCRPRPQALRSHYQTRQPRLNHQFISIHHHDYLDLSHFLDRLEREGPNDLAPQKTVFVFLNDTIISMPYSTYGLTLKRFEAGIHLDEYYKLMHDEGIFDLSYHRNLVARLFESNVLC